MLTLVTGAAGLLGQNVVRALLARGRRVRALVHTESASLDGLGVEARGGDLLDRSSLDDALAGVEIVYHLAALISIAPRDGPRVLRTNVLGTRNVVEACLASRVRRLVHVSSVHALRSGGSAGVTDESAPPNVEPQAPAYDRSKSAGEATVREGIARGLDAVVVNPTGIIGPHDYRPKLTGRALIDIGLGKLPFAIAGGFNWVDARDVAAGALGAEARGRSGERYLLSGHWAGMTELARLIAESTGRRHVRVAVPLWVAELGLPVIATLANLTGSPPLYTGPALRALREHRNCSNAKARRELGFAPRPLERTIADTFAFYAQAGLLERGARRGRSLPADAFVDRPPDPEGAQPCRVLSTSADSTS